jgi:putative Mg2+ transporter-C (MgtC) family protein
MSVLATIWTTVQAEFSDLTDVERITRAAWRMGEALLLGAAIGWDRERREAEAGLRTHMLVSLGAALFVLVPLESGMNEEQVSRVVQGLVAGIGFLGAGAVLKDQDEGRIHGLTTAATIWATAAVGLAAGLGQTGTALLATLFILLVLVWLRRWGRAIRREPDGDDEPSARRGH